MGDRRPPGYSSPPPLGGTSYPPGQVPEPIKASPGRSISFAVGALNDLHSAIWWVRATNPGDVYAGFRTSVQPAKAKEVFKLSLHQSGKWRIGFTEDAAVGMVKDGDRAMQRFVPPPDVSPGVKNALTIIVPMLSLHRNPEHPLGNKKVSWWKPIAASHAIRFDIFQRQTGSPEMAVPSSALGVVGRCRLRDGFRGRCYQLCDVD